MGKETKLAYLAICSALLTGCAGPTALESPKHPYDFRGYTGPDTNAVDMARKIKLLDEDADCCRRNPTKECRNHVAGALKGYIDDFWRQFKSEFNGRVGATNVLFDGATSTITAAAAINTSESAKSTLAALATSLLAIRTSAQKNLVGEQTAIVLVGQMDSDRLIIGARVDGGLDAELRDYSLNRAMSDLAEYASSMSVISALISLQRAGGANAQKLIDQQAATALAAEKVKTEKLTKDPQVLQGAAR